MKCPKCGNEVDASICVACPVCRTPLSNTNYSREIGMQDSFGNVMTVGGNLNQPKPRKKGKVNLKVFIPVIIIVGIVLLFGIILPNSTSNNQNQNSKDNSAAYQRQNIEYLPVTATQYFQDYQSNAVAADYKYKNKYLAVTGKITEIGTDVLNRAYIEFEIEYVKEVMCYFTNSISKSQLANVSVGQTVTVYGVGGGETLHGYTVAINYCSLNK